MTYTFTRTGAQIEEIHNTVEDPKSNTQFSDDIRTIAGEYRGLWPDTGGSANKGDTYQTQVSGTPTGQYFTALQNTTVDPVGDDVNWREVVSGSSIGLQEVIATGSANPRRLDDRFADFVNVKDFGAVGDGINDDSLAILYAVDTGRSVYIPKGNYRITRTIQLPANCDLIGAGRSATIITIEGSNAGISYGGYNVVKGFQITMPSGYANAALYVDLNNTQDNTQLGGRYFGGHTSEVSVISDTSSFGGVGVLITNTGTDTGRGIWDYHFDIEYYRCEVAVSVHAKNCWVNSNSFSGKAYGCPTIVRMRRTGAWEARANKFNFISQTDVNFATGANLYDVPTDIFITHNEFNHQDWDIQPRLTHGPFLGGIGLNKELTGTVQHFTSVGEYAFIGTLADSAGSVFLSTSVFLYNGDAYKVRFYPVDSNTLAYSLEGPKSNPPFDFLTRKVGDFFYLYINGDTGSYINLRDQESIGFTSCFYTSTVAGADLITDGCVTPTLQRQTVYYNDQSGVNMKINSTSNLEFDSLDGRIIHDGLLESYLDTLDRTLPGTFYFRLLGDGSTGLTSGLYYFGEMVAFGGYVDGNGYGTTQTVTNQDGNKLTRIFKSSWSSWVVV